MKCRDLALAAPIAAAVACSSGPDLDAAAPPPCGNLAAFRFEHGGDGHADPFGAKAAGQARAGKIRDASQIVQGRTARQKVRVGDFVLANEHVAVYIDREGRAEGYGPFGGDIVAIEPVGDDGRPLGVSQYGEMLVALSRQTVKPERVSVVSDGADGKAAIVRVSGVLADIPFLDTFKALSQAEYGFPAAIDYVLEPGAEKVGYRLSLANTTEEPIDFSNLQRVGFFHSSRHLTFTEANGYAPPKGEGPWVAFDSGDTAFLVRGAGGRPIRSELEVSGFQLFSVNGLTVDACEQKTVDYLEIVTGAPGIDGLLEAKRRVDGEAAWRELRGFVKEQDGQGLASAIVHAMSSDGRYLTRAVTNEDGAFVLHLPNGETTTLTPTAKGWAIPPATAVADGTEEITLTLPKRATIDVDATDEITGEALPVRVQVVPETPPTSAPASFGVRGEVAGRLWQEFAITGRASLPVPAGTHRVIVSRGYEYDLWDETVTADPAAPVTIEAKLRRSVDTTGVMCADFHIHSFYSADSADPAVEKVKGAIVDGLDIPVSSEHEWVIDFQPIIQDLGLTKWAFGMPSEELTTFTWGHFGVVPLYPRQDAPNNGAIDWIGKKPVEFFKIVHELPEKPVLVVNHPSGMGFGAYFSAAGFDRAAAAGTTDLWSDSFAAVEVFNDSDFESNRNGSVADWFALLSTGKTHWALGSSDSHDQRTSPAGYPRTCLTFGHDDPTKLSSELVRDVLRAGAATVSGGLYLTVEGPGGVGPGETSTPGAYDVVVQAPSWLSASTLEVIVDGVTTETIPLQAVTTTEPGKRYQLTVNVTPSWSALRHWVVFHAKGDGDLAPLHPGRKPFAVTNPIFF